MSTDMDEEYDTKSHNERNIARDDDDTALSQTDHDFNNDLARQQQSGSQAIGNCLVRSAYFRWHGDSTGIVEDGNHAR
ncbi:hypothetical protein BDZ89DRAFT_1147110 [Hymenopellis radicata]|nr:hypothetical protein BDZ89DRAFT_1147110 [Hymenopellis radicata]